MSIKNFCQDCGKSDLHHVSTWIDEITTHLLPPLRLPQKVQDGFDILLEKFFLVTRLAWFRSDFTEADIQLRSSCFIKEAQKRGASVSVLESAFGLTGNFKMSLNDRVFRFETLPTADFRSKYGTSLVDDKVAAKRHCQKGSFPIADGGSFWFWQKRKALKAAQRIGFPLVVKPRGGSVSRHVTTNIQSEDQLQKAIRFSLLYSPAFIIEKFLANTSVFRATVIDFDFVAVVQQMPANVIGDGVSTVRELIDRKNNDPKRNVGPHKQLFFKITEDTTTRTLLSQKGYSNDSAPQAGEIVFLQKDPFLKLGGDLVEVTSEVHPDNRKLFSDVARFFDIRVVGIDFLVKDIRTSWREQPCAILELNSAPCIELHHFPSSGAPTNPGEALASMFFKYYVEAKA